MLLPILYMKSDLTDHNLKLNVANDVIVEIARIFTIINGVPM
ncbi:hypothetical protein [Ferruginibacter sp.]|nr:hypothetical protein [Ferruginibacter sp.]